ncbi:hypothetical protein LINGRAHAP2_LOCUS9263, partial [Linum grandiflorum]
LPILNYTISSATHLLLCRWRPCSRPLPAQLIRTLSRVDQNIQQLGGTRRSLQNVSGIEWNASVEWESY